MIALLLALLVAEAPDWFKAVQYTPRPVNLRGCSECRGEPDDVCEVRAGAQSLRIEEYARDRWPAPGRIKLLRSKADPDCAVQAEGPKGLLGPRGVLELAAIRLAEAAPSALLAEKFSFDRSEPSWPRAPSRRKNGAHAAKPARASLRQALICWPSERGWPQGPLDSSNLCEWWLLPLRENGDADLLGASVPFAGKPFPYGDARYQSAFDASMPLDESSILGGATAAAPKPAPPPPPPVAPARCSEPARSSAALDRFDQWDAQIRGSARPSLDRAAFTLNAAAWAGHCQELDLLRSALERQLGCVLETSGNCLAAAK